MSKRHPFPSSYLVECARAAEALKTLWRPAPGDYFLDPVSGAVGIVIAINRDNIVTFAYLAGLPAEPPGKILTGKISLSRLKEEKVWLPRLDQLILMFADKGKVFFEDLEIKEGRYLIEIFLEEVLE